MAPVRVPFFLRPWHGTLLSSIALLPAAQREYGRAQLQAAIGGAQKAGSINQATMNWRYFSIIQHI